MDLELLKNGNEIWPARNGGQSVGWKCGQSVLWSDVSSSLESELPKSVQMLILERRIVLVDLIPSEIIPELDNLQFYKTVAPEMFHQDTPRIKIVEDGSDFGVLVWPNNFVRRVSTVFTPESVLSEKVGKERLIFSEKLRKLRLANALYEVQMSNPLIVFFDNKFLFHSPLGGENTMQFSTALYRRLYKSTVS